MIKIVLFTVLALAALAAAGMNREQMLSPQQNQQLRSIFDNSTSQSKDALLQQLTQFGNSLQQPQQGPFLNALQTVERYQTEMPTGLSSEAQQVVQQIQNVVNDGSLNVGQIRDQVIQIGSDASPAVRRELWRFVRQQMSLLMNMSRSNNGSF